MYEYLEPIENLLTGVRKIGESAGSSAYGWVSYSVPFIGMKIDYHDLYNKNGEELFEVSSPDILISAKRQYTGWILPMSVWTPQLHQQTNVYWNGRIIKETVSRKTPFKTYISHVGDLLAIKEAITSLKLLAD